MSDTPSDKSEKRKLVDTSALKPNSPVKRILFHTLRPSLEALLGIKKINRMYSAYKEGGLTPAEFSADVLKELGVSYTLPEQEIKRLQKHDGPLVFVANHPFGGVEGLLLIVLMDAIRKDFKVMANFMLGAVEEIRPNLIMVDPFDEDDSAARNMAPIKEAIRYLRYDGFLGVFPSGEVAALKLSSGKIEEPDWNPNIAKLIMRTGAAVVPVYFHGKNSLLFQMAGLVSPKLRTPLLIREFVRTRKGKELKFSLGHLISADKIQRYDSPDKLNEFLRSTLFLMSLRYPRRKYGIRVKAPVKGLRRNRQKEVAKAETAERLNYELERLDDENHLLEHGDYSVYKFTAVEAPHILRELGRIREVTFRAIGEGTGEELDLGEYDTIYDHLIIWDNSRSNIVGAYRLAKIDKIIAEYGRKGLYNTTTFDIEPELFDELSPAIELSRAFVAYDYQRSYSALMLLWMGIARYIQQEPRYRYLIGSLSVSNDFHEASRNFLVQFLKEHHLDTELAAKVQGTVPFEVKSTYVEDYYEPFKVENINDLQDLVSQVETPETRIPVLMKQYLKLGAKVLGFNIDPDFNNCLDVLIYVDLTQSPPDVMKKYWGEKGQQIYADTHGLPIAE